MLTRLSARLASVAAPDPSSQSKDVAAGRALNPSDSSWVGSSSELADFSAALTDDNLTKAMAMLGEAEDSWSDSQKRFALIMRIVIGTFQITSTVPALTRCTKAYLDERGSSPPRPDNLCIQNASESLNNAFHGGLHGLTPRAGST